MVRRPERRPLLVFGPFNWKADSLPDEPNCHDPTSVQAIIDSLVAEGVPPHIVYAFRKTGMLLTSEMYDRLPPEERRKWDDALREFEALEWDAERNVRQ